jgi:hypothetical protein
MQNLATVFDFLFECHHSNLSRVFYDQTPDLSRVLRLWNGVQVFTRDDVHRAPSCPAGRGKTWRSQAMATCWLGRCC